MKELMEKLVSIVERNYKEIFTQLRRVSLLFIEQLRNTNEYQYQVNQYTFILPESGEEFSIFEVTTKDDNKTISPQVVDLAKKYIVREVNFNISCGDYETMTNLCKLLLKIESFILTGFSQLENIESWKNKNKKNWEISNFDNADELREMCLKWEEQQESIKKLHEDFNSWYSEIREYLDDLENKINVD